MHSDYRSWLDDADSKSIFGGSVTLDPNAVALAWERLAQDTWALEVQSIPRTMHAALMYTLEKTGKMKHGR